MRNGRSFCAIALFFLLSASTAFSQAVKGTVVGAISDATGAVVPNAKVKITETNTSIAREVETNASGFFTVPNVDPGRYRVEVEVTGFRKAIQDGVDVLSNTTVRVDLQLQPGAVSESVTVTAEAALLQTDRTDTGRKIDAKTIIDMPLPMNRNFQGLLNLVPGTTRAFRPHSQFFNSQDSLSTQVNGLSRMANNVQIEGVDNNHRTGLLTVLIPPIEALQAVDITTSNYEAELGRAGGAVTNVTLKSGTNEFHGSAFWYNRLSALSARNTFLTRRPRSTYNYYGGTFGGPIIRNKLFFFADYLGIQDRLGYGQLLTIPSAEYRSGNFAGATTIYDPASGAIDGTNRQPFANNLIPAARVSPIARRILDQLPAPTRPGQGVNFERALVQGKDTHSYDAKVDWQAGQNDRVSVRYSYQRPQVTAPSLYGDLGGPCGTGNDGFCGTGTNKTLSSGVNYTRVFSPTLVSEFRLGVSRYRNDAQNTDYGKNTAESFGIRGANLSEFTSGMTSIDITGYSNPVVGFSASLPWVRAETNWNLVNNWTKILGNHTLKAGFDVRLNRDSLLQTQTFSPRGRFDFRVGTTNLNVPTNRPATSAANAFASFLIDAPNRWGRDLPAIYPDYIQNPFFTYIQDKWQINQKLTLDLGLRHELYPPARPRLAAGFSNYNPADNSLVLAGVGNVPRNLGRKTYYNFFAPRLGLSYRVNPKTVVRAGYGISYMPFPDNSYAYNFPVRQNNVLEPLTDFHITGSMAAGFPPPLPAAIPTDGIIRNAALNQSYDVIPLDFKEGYVQSYNLAVQRSLPGNFALEVAYVGNRGVRIPTVYNLNAGFVLGAGAAGRPLFSRFGRAADTNLRFVGMNSYYNSMQMKFDRRFNNGFALTTAYTYAKSIDYNDNNGGLRFYIGQDRNKARSNYDREHTFVQSYIYDLPFGKGKKMLATGPGAMLLGGWQVNGAYTLMSGLPLNFSNSASQLNAPGTTNTPNLIGEFRKLGGIGAAGTWFDVSAFDRGQANVPGNLGRNILSGPGFVDVAFSVFRRFVITERVSSEFRFESFNFTNTPQYGLPNTELGNANFGRVTGLQGDAVGNPRTMQFGLRFVF